MNDDAVATALVVDVLFGGALADPRIEAFLDGFRCDIGTFPWGTIDGGVGPFLPRLPTMKPGMVLHNGLARALRWLPSTYGDKDAGGPDAVRYLVRTVHGGGRS